MNEKDWLVLKTIYEERNITKAAEKLYTSQPSISYRLQQLEDEIGVKIINRSKKGIKFTSEGEYLVKYSKGMLTELQKMKEHLLNMNKEVEGIIRLGVSSNFAHYKLPSILASFLELFPKVIFNVNTGYSSEMLKLLHSDSVHIAIIRGDNNWDNKRVLISEESMAIISKNKIKTDDLPTLPRISYKTDPLLRQLIDNWWHLTFNQPSNITMEVDKIDTCKEMVLHGLGYAIIPSICLKEDDRLETIDLTQENGEVITRKTWMIYHDNELEFSVVRAFVEFMHQYSNQIQSKLKESKLKIK